MTFPAPVPEIPAANVDQAAAYYVDTLDFTFDWGGRPRRHCRHLKGELQTVYHQSLLPRVYGNMGPILFWLNLNS